MKINTGLGISALTLLLTACASTPSDTRDQTFGKGLPTNNLEPITSEQPPTELVINNKGISDKDGDAVIDKRDKCNKPVKDDDLIDNTGCRKVLSTIKTINLTIEFGSNSHKIPKKYYAEIKKLAKMHNKNRKHRILIEGHTDSRGSRSKNMALSTSRARAVGRLLVDNYGVKEGDILISGFGPDQPIASNKTSEGRQKNRRMVAHLVYEDRVIQHQWNIWSVELDDKKEEIKQFYNLVDRKQDKPKPAKK